MPDASTYRIGIDVGGTFTHAVAIEDGSLRIVAQAKVLTTHRASEGVARGIADALSEVLRAGAIPPAAVRFIAHSTTQATNALLEGDVAPVGIIALGAGLEGRRAKAETQLGAIALGAGRALRTEHRFLDSASLDRETIAATIRDLAATGVAALVATEAFSVDDPRREQFVMEVAAAAGLPCTGTHEISGRYGLRVRTRTAAVNASILPKMIEAAALTEKCVREAGIPAQLMVMRSDGGVMSIEEVRRRPLLTILSGPAAGVAAALMYLRISDGVFLEVGGTSTDISLVRDGESRVRTAEIGGHRLFLRTLDVRTVGLAGGSMPRLGQHGIAAVGPRSAHLAGLSYACFSTPDQLASARALRVAPLPGDPEDYGVVETPAGRFAGTITCAANALARVPAGDYALGDQVSSQRAMAALGEAAGLSAEATATEILRLGSDQLTPIVETLITEYGVAREHVTLIGGGGGAGAIVPTTAERMSLPHRIAENAPVISAIGVALALVRDTVERTIPNPSREDLLRVRREAEEAAIRAGAAPETIEVQMEVDPQRNLVRAVATGATEMRARDLGRAPATMEERQAAAAASLGMPVEQFRLLGETSGLAVFGAEIVEGGLWGLMKRRRTAVRVVDPQGVIRLQLRDAIVLKATAETGVSVLAGALDTHSQYGDGGVRLPPVHLLAGSRIFDLRGMVAADQILALAQSELERLSSDEAVVFLVER